MGIYISPENMAEIVDWSFSANISYTKQPWNGRDILFIFFSYGIDPAPYKFFIDVKVRISYIP